MRNVQEAELEERVSWQVRKMQDKSGTFILFSPGRNCAQWLAKHFDTLHRQTHQNFVHIVVDDASTDDTYAGLLQHRTENTVIYRNTENMGWMWNAVTYLGKHIKSEEDILLCYDLDDWLFSDEVLQRLRQIYDAGYWMTYGGFVRSSGKMHGVNWRGHREETLLRRCFRSAPWRLWQLRTFKAFLWEQIEQKDLRGPDGTFPKMGYDHGIGYPLLELCPSDRLYYVGAKESLYVYNTENPLADKTIHQQELDTVNKHYCRGVTRYQTQQQTRFVIFSAGQNCGDFVKQHLESVAGQSYQNYTHVIVDDASIDWTWRELRAYGNGRCVCYRNAVSVKWLANATDYIDRHIQSENDVVVVLDLDDWLAHKDVLLRLNEIYRKEAVWLTYGQFKHYYLPEKALEHLDKYEHLLSKDKWWELRNEWLGRIKFRLKIALHNKVVPQEAVPVSVLENRQVRQRDVSSFTHLKTFKAFLWGAVDYKDLYGPDGKFAPCSYDRAIMYPMVEMCSPEKVRFVSEVLCVYNVTNPFCNAWWDRARQDSYRNWFNSRPVYNRLCNE